MSKQKRSLGGYRPQEVQRYLELLRLELTIIKDQLASEQAKFEERLAARLKNNEQIRAELQDALAQERRIIEDAEPEAPNPS
ncbi:hypothetical protein K0T92_07935 [Paenibacillus oenotherae]|uniref:DivIVA domain-containing protein n=1 Tax=Paenibacillus oenotherae TaxID=1435645 RepID=A0ABS7D541_9BACL|nr:hypothetical protein [Paenibacillus oenotherae]MBW7474672.1 hypothetical protein [Paenibacillus oenotherae]